MGHEQTHRLRCNVLDTGRYPPPQLHEKMSGKDRDIFLYFSQGGKGDRYHVEAIKKVFPEVALSYTLLEVPVGCGNEPEIDRLGPLGPQRLDFLFLKDPEELRL